MSDVISYGSSLLIAVVIYWTDRLFPKWFGGVYDLAFLIFMVYVMITRGQGNLISMFLVLVIGEAVISSLWLWAREDKKKKRQKELDKMKAKDLSKNKEEY
ncbi:integral membrane protein [Lactiplantibacillus plantarum]|nr:integral membrane protein [Lactiplantibacillus plantarum]